MEWLKKNFLQISIKSQINFGVITVSLCVCILVFILLGINVFILLNMSYVEMINLFDTKETQQIDSTALYIDFKVELMADISKTGIQWIRNMIENLNRNNDFMTPFQSQNSTKYIRLYNSSGWTDCNHVKYRSCMVYQVFSQLDQIQMNKSDFSKSLIPFIFFI